MKALECSPLSDSSQRGDNVSLSPGVRADHNPTESLRPERGDHESWLVWQLIDSALPTGGFAHSSGLEAAWQQGEVRQSRELASFVRAGLGQLGRASLPFVTASHSAPERLPELDELYDVFTTNHVANRSSRAQGLAFLRAIDCVATAEQASRHSTDSQESGADKALTLRYSHFAPVFGASLCRLGISRETVMRMFFFNYLRGVLAAAVRLNIAGPMEAQVLQRRLARYAEVVLRRCELLKVEEIAQTAPLQDLWQGAHDRLYSRLFQS